MSIRPQSSPIQSRWSNLVRRHPLTTFFVLTYAAAWLLWMPLVVFQDTLPEVLALFLVLLGSWVPSSVAILLIATLHGRVGVRKLFRRLLKWRVGLRWYVVVLILPMLVLLGLSLSVRFGGGSPAVDATIISAVVLLALSIFPGSALGEELGWRGFALPHLQADRSALGASIVLGALWGVWHLPLYMSGKDSRPPSIFPAFVIAAIALSVFYTWMYNSTQGSLLIVVLFHAATNLPLTLFIAPLEGDSAQPFRIYVVLLVIAASAVVAGTGAANLSSTQQKQVETP